MTVQSRRKSLQAVLEEILGSGNVYFQPPSGIVMEYPCITYSRDNASTKSADNIPYAFAQRYSVTLIDQNPDSDVYDRLTQLEYCAFNRHFETSGLNHDVFVIYY